MTIKKYSLFFQVVFFIQLKVTAQSYFPIPDVPNKDQFVKNISYTAHLLTSSTAENQKEVRILVYGQSISMQDWWNQVKAYLVKKYPDAKINMINKAIGGFSTGRLKLMVENDVVAFYPDLILLHDYGGEPDYEIIIETIRSTTTAEVVLQTDHIAVNQNEEWHRQHNDVWMPETARKYNVAVADVRSAWKEYLTKNNLQAKDLLTDNVHLNAHGNYLMAGILIKYFEAIPVKVEVNTLPVKALVADKDFKANQAGITVRIEGNRVDVVRKTPAKEEINIKVDGKNPEEILACYYYTRPSKVAPDKFFLTNVGQLLKMELVGFQQEEEWTLTITAVDSVNQKITFSLAGSKTGADGTGSNVEPFVSTSGRIKIEPENWFIRQSPGDFNQFSWLKPGEMLKWQVKSMCTNKVSAGSATTTILQGIKNGAHTIHLSGKGLKDIEQIKVYQPALKK